ncbi:MULTISPECIES: hypothetical protein [Stenotrophomonas maltophilia group]|uniref:hypothetical protein n=1 Tax=Stenotrophomonas maltophilia group TaxID=995085 RepID=UPI00209027E8|nr:hypothetical protein [Stenotrophomonas maltophilia]MCO5735588.1 hypothetical protein [Stenotrophomonas maltophilia]
MNPLVQFLLSLLAGAFLFLLAVGHDYWKRLRWLFGWDPNLGHESADKLISIANRTVLGDGRLAVGLGGDRPIPVPEELGDGGLGFGGRHVDCVCGAHPQRIDAGPRLDGMELAGMERAE